MSNPIGDRLLEATYRDRDKVAAKLLKAYLKAYEGTLILLEIGASPDQVRSMIGTIDPDSACLADAVNDALVGQRPRTVADDRWFPEEIADSIAGVEAAYTELTGEPPPTKDITGKF